MTRLEMAAEVAAAAAALSDPVLHEQVGSIVIGVAKDLGVHSLCEGGADLDAVVAMLDETAWDLQDRGAEGYDLAFRQARAANAWWCAFAEPSRASALEALYEAIHAVGGDAAAVLTIARQLAP